VAPLNVMARGCHVVEMIDDLLILGLGGVGHCCMDV